MALAAFFLLAALASGATDGGSTPNDFTGSPVTTCLSGNCENGIGIREDPKGTYEGAFENGRQNGLGTYTSAAGLVYVGEWKDDKAHGKGTFTWPEGGECVGQWVRDKKHGKNKCTWPDGKSYDGLTLLFLPNFFLLGLELLFLSLNCAEFHDILHGQASGPTTKNMARV